MTTLFPEIGRLRANSFISRHAKVAELLNNSFKDLSWNHLFEADPSITMNEFSRTLLKFILAPENRSKVKFSLSEFIQTCNSLAFVRPEYGDILFQVPFSQSPIWVPLNLRPMRLALIQFFEQLKPEIPEDFCKTILTAFSEYLLGSVEETFDQIQTENAKDLLVGLVSQLSQLSVPTCKFVKIINRLIPSSKGFLEPLLKRSFKFQVSKIICNGQGLSIPLTPVNSLVEIVPLDFIRANISAAPFYQVYQMVVSNTKSEIFDNKKDPIMIVLDWCICGLFKAGEEIRPKYMIAVELWNYILQNRLPPPAEFYYFCQGFATVRPDKITAQMSQWTPIKTVSSLNPGVLMGTLRASITSAQIETALKASGVENYILAGYRKATLQDFKLNRIDQSTYPDLKMQELFNIVPVSRYILSLFSCFGFLTNIGDIFLNYLGGNPFTLELDNKTLADVCSEMSLKCFCQIINLLQEDSGRIFCDYVDIFLELAFEDLFIEMMYYRNDLKGSDNRELKNKVEKLLEKLNEGHLKLDGNSEVMTLLREIEKIEDSEELNKAKNVQLPKEEPILKPVEQVLLEMKLEDKPRKQKKKEQKIPKKKSVKPKPAKVEPAKVEPVKLEPVKLEPVKLEPVKLEPVKLEPVKLEPVKPAQSDAQLCTICLDRPRTHLTLECGHLHYCEQCVALLKECAICRAPVIRALRVYN